MGYKDPPKDHQFKPGQSGNPLGSSVRQQVSSKMKRLTAEQLAEVGSLILDGNCEDLAKLALDREAPVLKVWFASVAVKAIAKGDAQSLNILLDRIVGKVKGEISISTGDGPLPLAHMSDDDIEAEFKRLTQA